MIPAIFGLSGLTLTADERAFFRDSEPAGYILFGRNIENREQLLRLTDELRSLEGRGNLPILIDQEGGRVARMKAPEWPDFPSGAAFDALYERAPASAIEAARLNAMALASMMAEVGITVDCLPLLDVRQPGASDVIGDRALGSEPMRVAALGRTEHRTPRRSGKAATQAIACAQRGRLPDRSGWANWSVHRGCAVRRSGAATARGFQCCGRI